MKLSPLQVIKNRIDDAGLHLRKLLGFNATKQVQALPYRGYGRKDYAYLRGRVLEGASIEDALEDSRLRNLRNNWKRFESDEVYNAEVHIRTGENEFVLRSDREGYFRLDRKLDVPFEKAETQNAIVTLQGTPLNPDAESIREVPLFIPPEDSTYGIISDVDDTVLQSDITSLFKIKTMYHTAFRNAHKRMPTEGAVEFFQLLQKGPDGERNNPCFYVSNSPWNLYDLLTEFLDINDLPKGPVLLRDFGLSYREEEEGYRGHKHEEVRKILMTYPDLPFVLIGDAGEHDADIYKAVAEEFPDQVRAIYIRDVNKKKNAERVERIVESMQIPMCLTTYGETAIAHARAHGLIPPEG